jgi:hypothetical protein
MRRNRRIRRISDRRVQSRDPFGHLDLEGGRTIKDFEPRTEPGDVLKVGARELQGWSCRGVSRRGGI